MAIILLYIYICKAEPLASGGEASAKRAASLLQAREQLKLKKIKLEAGQAFAKNEDIEKEENSSKQESEDTVAFHDQDSHMAPAVQ